ncbi:hypothetical protein P3T42_004124 [Paraburkholderia sp. GAS38]|uniref:hypothetical protein n=1 Tax=Paraburkholderia sp. GAS38 TaxID=3035133 RepID=UPI003D1A1D67
MKFLRLAILISSYSFAMNSAHAVCEEAGTPYPVQWPSANQQFQKIVQSKNIKLLQFWVQQYNELTSNADSNGSPPSERAFDSCFASAYAEALNQLQNPQVSASNNANPSAANTKAQSKESNVHYQAPRGRCLALKVEGDSILVENHCGIPIVGQFCFIHSQLHSCTDSTAASFGPVGAGNEVMIATTTDTNPRSNELKYVLCNADAAEHGQCEPHHP